MSVGVPASPPVQLWLFPTSQLTASARIGAVDLLSRDERDRSDRFVFDQDRNAFVAAHALLRLVLAAETGVAPDHLAFSTNRYGKPALAGASGAHDARFNISHTRDLVVCAVTRGHEIGVDAERLGDPPLAIAERFFAPPEIAALGALPPAAKAQAFYEIWTLKEAFIKARGVGLSMPLDAFAVQRNPPGLLRFGDVMAPEHWWFSLTGAPGHAVALCVEGPLQQTPVVTTTWLRPESLAARHLLPPAPPPVHGDAGDQAEVR